MLKTSRKTALLWSVLLATTALSGHAHADVTDQLLDRLKEKGILSNGEYRTFKAKHAAEVRANRTRVVTREVVKVKERSGVDSDLLQANE